MQERPRRRQFPPLSPRASAARQLEQPALGGVLSEFLGPHRRCNHSRRQRNDPAASCSPVPRAPPGEHDQAEFRKLIGDIWNRRARRPQTGAARRAGPPKRPLPAAGSECHRRTRRGALPKSKSGSPAPGTA